MPVPFANQETSVCGTYKLPLHSSQTWVVHVSMNEDLLESLTEKVSVLTKQTCVGVNIGYWQNSPNFNFKVVTEIWCQNYILDKNNNVSLFYCCKQSLDRLLLPSIYPPPHPSFHDLTFFVADYLFAVCFNFTTSDFTILSQFYLIISNFL